MLNGPIYLNLVKYLWVRSKVYDKFGVENKLREKQAEFEENKERTQQELGSKDFTETEIRPSVPLIKFTFKTYTFNKIHNSKKIQKCVQENKNKKLNVTTIFCT